MLEWVIPTVSLGGGVLIFKIIYTRTQRSFLESALQSEKAKLVSSGAYSHIEEYVHTNGMDLKKGHQLQVKLQEEGFGIQKAVLKGLIMKEYMINPTFQKEAIRKGGAYHLIENYARKFGNDLREIARLKTIMLEYGFKVEEIVLQKLIDDEHRLNLRIKALIRPGKAKEIK